MTSNVLPSLWSLMRERTITLPTLSENPGPVLENRKYPVFKLKVTLQFCTVTRIERLQT